MNANLYNNKTLEQIAGNMPESMPELHRNEYLSNCKKVIECQTSGYNLNEIDGLKNYNFILISLYFQQI